VFTFSGSCERIFDNAEEEDDAGAIGKEAGGYVGATV
jgi:hypothetical protein